MFKEDEAVVVTGHWTADEARAVLARWQASGLTKTVFAERHGLTTERLRRWEKRLAERSQDGEVEVRLVPLVARGTTVSREGVPTRLQLPGGAVLEFEPSRVNPGWVAALVVDVARGA